MAPTAIRLDKRVSEQFGLSRRAAQEAVLNGKIDLDGSRCDEPGLMIEPERRVEFFPNRPKARRVQTKKLKVLHEDRHLIIVDKPPGLLTLPTAAHESDTLADRVRDYLKLQRGSQTFAGIIHRLDKETSGAIAFGRSREATRAVQNLLRVHDVERRYLAIVEGKVVTDFGTIDKPLVNEPGEVRRRIARDDDDDGRRAVTRFQVLERIGNVATVMACWLETGRTHQIRIHLADLGHPVVGDPVYRPLGLKRSRATFVRQALHAQTLGFLHPMTGQEIRVEAPPPPDLAKLIVDLRNHFGQNPFYR